MYISVYLLHCCARCYKESWPQKAAHEVGVTELGAPRPIHLEHVILIHLHNVAPGMIIIRSHYHHQDNSPPRHHQPLPLVQSEVHGARHVGNVTAQVQEVRP